MRPVIGITPLLDTERNSYWMLPGYMNCVEEAGGLPVMLSLAHGPEMLKETVELCDGFLFTGGPDIGPERYGQQRLPECGEPVLPRDRMELALMELVLQADKPLAGICRGLQMLNVALGGTLWQDLPTQRSSSIAHRQTLPNESISHSVILEQGAPLRERTGRDTLFVNSLHHQGIRDLAPALRPMARAEDGLVEAVWAPEHRFVWAVQWHPEFLYREDRSQLCMLQGLVEACQM